MSKLFGVCLLGAAILALISPIAVATERPGADQSTIPGEEIPAHLQDSFFERYVDVRLLGQALVRQDASLLCDAALQFMEAERVLLRSHKTVPADTVLKLAMRLAADKRDLTTLDRLSKVARARGNQELLGFFELVQKTAKPARKVDPSLVISVDNTSPEALFIFKSILDEINTCKLLGDRAGLDRLQKSLSSELHEKQRAHLAKLIVETRKSLPEQDDPALAVLQSLANAFRAATISKKKTIVR